MKDSANTRDGGFEAKALAKLDRLEKANERISRMLHLILRTVMDEDYGLPPWHDLPEPKMRQVERVFNYMVEHPASSVFNAARRSYAWLEGGYESMHGLYNRCVKCELELYVRDRRSDLRDGSGPLPGARA